MPRGGFPPLYRMARCRHCPFLCKPCLTIEEAEDILLDVDRRQFNGDALCQECHKKSNRYANAKLFKKTEEELDRMEKEIKRLRKEIAKLRG